jgi:G:T-mismatch repair DNA endonuclease (very short patch repair protein)
MEVLKKCCKSFHVSSSISFCNNLKKRQIQTNETKKNLLIALFLTPYIFLVNICFRTEKKSYPQKKIISLCEIKTTEKKIMIFQHITFSMLCACKQSTHPKQSKKKSFENEKKKV